MGWQSAPGRPEVMTTASPMDCAHDERFYLVATEEDGRWVLEVENTSEGYEGLDR